jgi:hypothetical protein
MNGFLIQTILAAGNSDGQESFWIQILVFLLVAVALGLYGFLKKKPGQLRGQSQRLTTRTSTGHIQSHRQIHLSHKRITHLKNAVQKYAARAKDIPLHIRKLSKESKRNLDTAEVAYREKLEKESTGVRQADLTSGMELLELDFLLSVVANTTSEDKNNVTMRKLAFNELVRRSELNRVRSGMLKLYAINQGNLYDKNIQCEAIREMSRRTAERTKRRQLQNV